MSKVENEFKGRPLLLIKFADEKWKLEEIQKGKLFLNTFKYFNDLEIEGMGDKYDGKHVSTEVDYKVVIQVNDKMTQTITGTGGTLSLTSKEDLKKHIFCTNCIEYKDLKIMEKGEEYSKGYITYSEEQKIEIKKDFGSYALIMFFPKFAERVHESFAKQGYDYIGDKVKYDNFSINYIERQLSFFENRPDKYFWKDNIYRNQNEYRITILNNMTVKPLKIDIGDISKFTKLVTVDELFRTSVDTYINPKTKIIL